MVQNAAAPAAAETLTSDGRTCRFAAGSLAEGPVSVPGVEAATPGLYEKALILFWLGGLHLAIFATSVCILCVLFSPYARPYGLAVLVLQATLAFLPVTRPFSETANRLSTHICLTAHRFFPLSVEMEDAAAFAVPNTTFVIGLEPHSVLPISVICFHPAAPLPVELLALKRCALASSAVFRVPGVRHLWQWLGLQSVDRKNAARLLAAGHSIILVPGGVQECLFMEADYETVFLKRRYGFVKLALQTGSPLVPAFSFGQSRTFKFYRPRVGALDALSRMLGFAPMVFWGQWGSPLPFAQRVHTVIGTPIPVAKTLAPTDQQVGELLERFIAEMTGLFERHKAKAGFPDLKLRVM